MIFTKKITYFTVVIILACVVVLAAAWHLPVRAQTSTPAPVITATATVTATEMATPTATVTAAPQFVTYLPIIFNYELPYPTASTSYYLKTVDPTILENMGCEVGDVHRQLEGKQDQFLILAFGTPKRLDDGQLGTSLFGFGPVSTVQITLAAAAFAKGYYACSDTESLLTIAIGTNNYAAGEVTAAHGETWARMVNSLGAWLVDQGLSGQVAFAGANDMELGWNGPTQTRVWLDSYDMHNTYPVYDFGDAAGCPPYGDCGPSSYPEWTQQDVWYKSWGNGAAQPAPLIYTHSGSLAEQWYRIALYSQQQYRYPMYFRATVTQWQACQQRTCNGTDNRPGEAYWQLMDRLNTNPLTQQTIPWTTDFKWYGE